MEIKDYLIHSYLYYVLNESVISDAEFDKLCLRLRLNWPNTQSIYKKYISKEDLKAGTGYNLFVDESGYKYPSEIIAAAETRLAQFRATQVVAYRVTTDDPDELYESLKDAKPWFLTGLSVDFKYFFKSNPSKQKMALGVVERILKERENGKEGEVA